MVNSISSDDTIAAISTPIGEGGIGIVRLSGADALKIADKIFVPKDGKKPSGGAAYTTHYGHVAADGGTIDEVLLTVMRAPKSYTKEDIVEINCHGGIQAAKKVLGLVGKEGARIAAPGEFTKRAFLNGRIDLAQAEAVLDVIRAKTEGSLKVALDQLEGGLSKSINRVREHIVGIASEVEAGIDFPDEELDAKDAGALAGNVKGCVRELKSLIDSYDNGIVLKEGVLAIICGKPNVGKSSLMNLLLKRDRCIVSPIPGTTRDAVEETISLNGIPIRLVDTAGIGRSRNVLDREGVKKSKKYLKLADVALLMLDASTKLDRKDLDIIRLVGKKKKIVVINKCDRAKKTDQCKIKDIFVKDTVVEISVKKRRNIELLEKAIAGLVWTGSFEQGECAIVSNARHKELLDKAYACMISVDKALEKKLSPELVAVDLKEAVEALGLIIGKSVSDDILDRIFEKFCIGK